MKTLYLPVSRSILRYHDLPGTQTPLIFIHGLGCASSCDYPRIAADPALWGRRMILVDLLGSGFSDQPTEYSYSIADQARSVEALVEELKLDSFDLFGHSMGGAVAIAAATLCQARLRRLVLSEPNLDPGGGFFSRSVAAFTEADYLSHGHTQIIRAALAEGNTIWAGSMRLSSPLAVHRESCSLIAGCAPTWREQLAVLPRPKAMLFGAHSLPDPDAERLPAAGVRVLVVPDAGHSMAWENPSGVASAIRAALDE